MTLSERQKSATKCNTVKSFLKIQLYVWSAAILQWMYVLFLFKYISYFFGIYFLLLAAVEWTNNGQNIPPQ